jgi:hypothetical protein
MIVGKNKEAKNYFNNQHMQKARIGSNGRVCNSRASAGTLREMRKNIYVHQRGEKLRWSLTNFNSILIEMFCQIFNLFFVS